MTLASPSTPPRPVAPEPVRRRLEQVLGRIRAYRLLAGAGRLLLLGAAALLLLYLVDRYLEVPAGVRALLELGALALLGWEAWRRVLRPLLAGPRLLDAARLVEGSLPAFEGRLVSALQLPAGSPGSLEHAVAEQAARAAEALDLRSVLTARPSLREAARGAGAVALLVALALLVRPPLDVFVQRLLLQDVPWPREVRLALELPDASPVHVRAPDGAVVAARGGVLNLAARWDGRRPERVELVVLGEAGERVAVMAPGSGRLFHGHVTVRDGDRALLVRGGDDDGADSRTALTVIDPPRLDEPRFVLEPPAYLGEPPREVEPAGLVVAEGTRVRLLGRPRGEAEQAWLLLSSREEPLPLALRRDEQGVLVEGVFTAERSDSLSVVLSGAWGLSTPDPSQHALLVREDRPPALRVYAPSRSDVKVTSRALVPLAVVAEDDHAIAQVTLEPKVGSPIPLQRDAERPRQFRHVLDLSQLDLEALGLESGLAYALEARDGRELPGKGPQVARVEGRRVDVVDASEVQRLLADRQLRLKEAFNAVSERQDRAAEMVSALAEAPAEAGDADLVAAAVAQGQVLTRLEREARELCAILEETITNRLDPGPGAEAVLQRRLDDWRRQAVDEPYAPGPWRALAADYGAGRFGRLDLVGRLLDMTALALDLSEDLAPAAQGAVASARARPDGANLTAAREAQAAVRETLQRLLERMDEWEDYQEVLTLVKMLIDDQKSIQQRTGRVLNPGGEN